MKKETILDNIWQHKDLRIRVNTYLHEPLSKEILTIFDEPVPSNIYYILLIVKGNVTKMMDFKDIQISDNQLLFVTPWQIHTSERGVTKDTILYRLSFGEELASYFLSAFSFFIDPLRNPVTNLDANTTQRMVYCFHQLENLLQKKNARPELMLEAQRKLYLEDTSIKELAYGLNYNDPEYFSRLFKKHK